MEFSRLAAAFALSAALFGAGCATEHYEMDAKHPAAIMTSDGMLEFRGRFYTAEQFPRALRRARVPTDRTINIRVPDLASGQRLRHRVLALLARAGYRRAVYVTEKHSTSVQANGIDPTKDPGYNFAPGEKVYGAGW